MHLCCKRTRLILGLIYNTDHKLFSSDHEFEINLQMKTGALEDRVLLLIAISIYIIQVPLIRKKRSEQINLYFTS